MTFTDKVDLLLRHLNDMPYHQDMLDSLNTPLDHQGIVAYKPEAADIGIRYDHEKVELRIINPFESPLTLEAVCNGEFDTYLHIYRELNGEAHSYRWCVGDHETICTSSEAEPLIDEWGGFEFDIDTSANST